MIIKFTFIFIFHFPFDSMLLQIRQFLGKYINFSQKLKNLR